MTYFTELSEINPGKIQPISQDSQKLDKDKRFSHLFQSTLDVKIEHKENVLKKRGGIEDVIVISNDIATTGFLLFESIEAFSSSSQSVSGILLAASICGFIGGFLNFAEAAIGFKEAYEAYLCGDTKLAKRQLASAIINIIIGSMMILESLAPFLGITFFSSNPWLLPIVFFLEIIPVFMEVFQRSWKIARGEDYGAKLQLKKIKEDINKKRITNVDEIIKSYQDSQIFDINEYYDLIRILENDQSEENFNEIKNKLIIFAKNKIKTSIEDGEIQKYKTLLKRLESNTFFNNINEYTDDNYQKILSELEHMIIEKLSSKMEEYQMNMGVNAAIEAFTFIKILIELKASKNGKIDEEAKNEIIDQIDRADNQIRIWNRIQFLRLFIQVLLTASFVAGWFSAGTSLKARLIDSINNFVMAIANFLPFYIDCNKPFDRDTNFVVAKAKSSAIYKKAKVKGDFDKTQFGYAAG